MNSVPLFVICLLGRCFLAFTVAIQEGIRDTQRLGNRLKFCKDTRRNSHGSVRCDLECKRNPRLLNSQRGDSENFLFLRFAISRPSSQPLICMIQN